MTKFKVGDRVKINCANCGGCDSSEHGEVGKIIKLNPNEEDHDFSNVKLENGNVKPYKESDLELIEGVRKSFKVNFLLKYDLDKDPIEEFETLVEVKKRIKELTKNDNLKRDSIILYEIKSRKEVTLETSVRINIK